MQWKDLIVAPERTHHLGHGLPAYQNRFEEVLKFHFSGLAPVHDTSGAYHIDSTGRAVYTERYRRTFGFYEERAAVQADEGWLHIQVTGAQLYTERYAWCGNFQEGRCTVRRFDHAYFHLRLDGKAAYREHYRYAGDYHDGWAVVQREDGRHSHVDIDCFTHRISATSTDPTLFALPPETRYSCSLRRRDRLFRPACWVPIFLLSSATMKREAQHQQLLILFTTLCQH